MLIIPIVYSQYYYFRVYVSTYLIWDSIIILKGQSNEICYLRFFHCWNPLRPLTRFLKTFRIWLRIW
jgi:hypothetical protein